jgi:streptogramin lyase
MGTMGRNRGLLRFFMVILIAIVLSNPGWLSNQVKMVAPVSAINVAAPPPSSFSLNEWNVPTPAAGPWGITTDQFGKIWFTENVTSKLASYDPTTNNFTEWSIPGAGSPRYVFTKQAPMDVSGGMNVTRVYFTAYSSNQIGYFNSWNGTFYEWQLPPGSNPVGVFVDANDTIWFTESGRDVIGRLTPSTNQLTEWTLPSATGTAGSPNLKPWGIYVQSALSGQFHNITDRYVWFTELANNAIGRLQVTNNLLVIWDLNSLNIIPGLKYGPMDITVDGSTPGNVIFSASTGDRISILQNCGTACTGYTEYVMPSRTSIAKPTSIDFDSSRGAVWFTEYNAGIIGYADLSAQGGLGTVPTSTPCVFPPTVGPSCAGPSGYATNIVIPTIANNVQGISSIGNPLPPTTVSAFQGPINGITEYKVPTNNSRPNFVTVDYHGNAWFTESNVTINRIARLSIPFVFTLSVSPNSRTVDRGQSTTFSVNVDVTSGYSRPVQLSISNPQNVSASFNPPVGSPPFSSTLTLFTSNSTLPGTYTMTVTATSSGQNRTSQIILIVNPSPPPVAFDYRIDSTNSTVTVLQGQQATFQFQITPTTSAPSQMVNLTIDQTGLPSGTSLSQFANPDGIPSFNSFLTLQTSVDTPAGSYDISNLITGLTSTGTSHHPQAALLVVTEIPRDFNLTVSSYAVSVIQASRINVIVSVTTSGPFTGSVSLNGNFSPSVPGLTVTFSPSTLMTVPNGGVSQANMEIVATRDTPGQTYQLTVIATSSSPSLSHQITVSVHVSPCLIATATFGSELSPEVQILRDFRDQSVLRTFAGSNFMSMFNSWYYSFSPSVAQYETANTAARDVARIMLSPLIWILQLSSMTYATLAVQPEIGILAAGMLASSLIGLVYLAIPMSGFFILLRNRLNSRRKNRITKSILLMMLSLLIAYCLSELFALATVMMFVSVGIVVVFLLGGSLSIVGITELMRRE